MCWVIFHFCRESYFFSDYKMNIVPHSEDFYCCICFSWQLQTKLHVSKALRLEYFAMKLLSITSYYTQSRLQTFCIVSDSLSLTFSSVSGVTHSLIASAYWPLFLLASLREARLRTGRFALSGLKSFCLSTRNGALPTSCRTAPCERATQHQ